MGSFSITTFRCLPMTLSTSSFLTSLGNIPSITTVMCGNLYLYRVDWVVMDQLFLPQLFCIPYGIQAMDYLVHSGVVTKGWQQTEFSSVNHGLHWHSTPLSMCNAGIAVLFGAM